ncbi:MAG: UDP-N-acetylglucosamine--N-acetylmuramyl-(pentapeptide) pyrophosphoryl-undecaprenol N-acetylglucosamine transferase [Parcubacteria group bacterium Gr01-1014_106]|nr:MAG: UDP-N-acetylglucosamine--N-acetylmuramyl-(pentapeptide) pyrophosphoryl-undecaprenol N-acetylglucosamine transferase [Parcubacteria group bacterium Gr01-1014_106]
MRIVLTGGGTGGHVTPLVAIAGVLRRWDAEGKLPALTADDHALEMLYVGVVSDMDRRGLEEAGIPYRHIPSGKIRRYLSGAHLTAVDVVCRLPVGILRAVWTLFVLMPDVIFSKGGYGAVPVMIAAWVYRIPFLLHETDSVPGLANQRFARFASAIAVGFPDAEKAFPPKKTFTVGTPLRPAFSSLPSPEAARQRLGLHDRKPVIFVTGGSQGAQRLNTVLLANVTRLLPEAQILHQVGEQNLAAVNAFVQKDLAQFPDIQDYHMIGFLSEQDMALSFAAADLIISRAGGTTLAEIAAAGKPSVLIPLREAAQQHQWENAYFFRERGAAAVLDESNLTPSVFHTTISRLLSNPQDLRVMAERVRSLHRPNAAEDLARILLEMAHGRLPQRALA